jgi:pimeloyl-ACP methyl ester carboxylesterase
VLAVDLPGFGHSEMPDGELTIRGMGRAVADAMDARGIERAVVVGNSMGGFVGIELALVAPEKVDKLVLVSAAALWNEGLTARPTVLISRLSRPYATRFYAQWQWQLALRHPRLRLPALASAGIRHPSAIPLDLAYELMSGSGTDGFYDAVQALFDYKIRDRLPEIAAPTLVVWGARDPLVPLWHAFEYEALIPDVRLTVFRDTGHVPQIERPGRFNEELAEYLGQTGVGEPEGTVVEVT